MTLSYYFGDEEFEYELDSDQVTQYLDSLSNEQIVDKAEEVFENYDEDEKQDLRDSLDGFSTSDGNIDWKALVEEDRDWVISEILFDAAEDFESEMENYFYDDASDSYNAYKSDQDDYNYGYGFTVSDFI